VTKDIRDKEFQNRADKESLDFKDIQENLVRVELRFYSKNTTFRL